VPKPLAFGAKEGGHVKDFYVKDASTRENQQITSFFLVASKQVRLKRNGEPYLALMLSDKTGSIEAKMWDNVAAVAASFVLLSALKRKPFYRFGGTWGRRRWHAATRASVA
jgi:DNA polymerase III alpha subunit